LVVDEAERKFQIRWVAGMMAHQQSSGNAGYRHGHTMNRQKTKRDSAGASGCVLARGLSTFDGSHVVAIAVGLGRASINRKTGPMIQVYVLPETWQPSTGLRASADLGICGGCKHRPAGLGTCYVDVAKGADVVWRAYRAGKYGQPHDVESAIGPNSVMRITAYGDCVALPLATWAPIVDLVRRKNGTVLGYTHHWRSAETGFQDFCMASVDSVNEQQAAVNLGWRTFRIRGTKELLRDGESQCPADSYADVRSLCGTEKHAVKCVDCRMCSGGREGPNISLEPHGAHNRKANLETWLQKSSHSP
jgi:hypothetical protein